MLRLAVLEKSRLAIFNWTEVVLDSLVKLSELLKLENTHANKNGNRALQPALHSTFHIDVYVDKR